MAGERKRRRTRGEILVMVMGGLIALGVPTGLLVANFLKVRAANIQLAHEWSIDGHPCPQVSKAEFAARRLKAPKGVLYSNATLFRQFGHMECSPITYDGGTGLGAYAVCQFTGPNVLKVTTSKGEWYFVPGMGQPATIATPHDIAHCVMASNFTM
ncbi:hypothetical protein [Phenylobacterium sp.]|uniref:hypothetical protein n=1 Tax=Phenylobacterium sp. TaxID=1871053 RepID=UPI0025D1D0E2|nr:hypothetical protein [Phenylobacterium sp.]